MENILKKTQKNFITVIVSAVFLVILTTWLTLQIVNVTHIGKSATREEVHNSASQNEALVDYIQDQEEFEAHFISLASSIKQQEKDRLTIALTATSVAMIIAGFVIAHLVVRILMKPVREAYSSQERFIQDAAHELRNPLAAMSIALQQVDDDKPNKKLIDTFRRQTKRLVTINEDLLFLERKTSSQKIQTLNLSELLNDVIEELQPMAKKKGVTLKTETSPNITKKMIASDYVRLIKNAIDNAIKYSRPNKSVEIIQKFNKNHIFITIKDHGIGIPKAEVANIGNRFYRAKNVGDIDGTGLGVAIMKKLLNSYGGSLSIVDTSPKGTTIIIKMPA